MRVRVVEVRGRCPVHRPGDEFRIEGGFVVEGRVCLHALLAMAAVAWALGHGHSPGDLGFSGPVRVRCPDPGPPLGSGSVTFELEP